jgi:hypothetical protein
MITRITTAYESEDKLSMQAIKVEIDLPYGHMVTIEDLGTDVAVIMHYPKDGDSPEKDVSLESIMKEV